MFGSNPGVCNVESTPVEAVVPVSGVGGGALSFSSEKGKCVVLATWEEMQAAGVLARTSRRRRRRGQRSRVQPAGGAARGDLVAAPAQQGISAPPPGALRAILLAGCSACS